MRQALPLRPLPPPPPLWALIRNNSSNSNNPSSRWEARSPSPNPSRSLSTVLGADRCWVSPRGVLGALLLPPRPPRLWPTPRPPPLCCRAQPPAVRLLSTITTAAAAAAASASAAPERGRRAAAAAVAATSTYHHNNSTICCARRRHWPFPSKAAPLRLQRSLRWPTPRRPSLLLAPLAQRRKFCLHRLPLRSRR